MIGKITNFEDLDKISSSTFDLVLFRPNIEKIPVIESRHSDWLFEESRKMIRLIKSTGSLVVFIKEGVHKTRRKTFCLEYLLKMAENDYWTETFIWNKINVHPTGNKKRLKDGFEYCFQFTRSNEYKFFPDSCLTKAKNEWTFGEDHSHLSRPSNVLSFPLSNGKDPVQLYEFFINLTTNENDYVLLPSITHGNELIACLNTKRGYLGICEDKDGIEDRISKWKDENIEVSNNLFS